MTAADASANATDSQEPVREWEELGRGVFSRSHRRRAANGAIPYQVFLERAGERNISVDRLSTAPDAVAAAIASEVAAQRDPPRRFYGWAVISAEHAMEAGCYVQASPLPGNPYHADIIMPDSILDNREEQRLYAVALAGKADWRPWQPPEMDGSEG